MASPELDLARYGKTGKANHFLGFWLSLIVEARGHVTAADTRRIHKSITRFLKDTAPAAEAAGIAAFHAELLEAAALYWETTQTDPSYSSTLFGLKRISPEELDAKVAAEAARTVSMLADINVADETARQLPRLLIEAMLRVMPKARDGVRAAVAKRPAAQASVGHLLED